MSQPKTLKLKNKLVIAIIEHMSKKMKHQHFQSSWYDSSSKLPNIPTRLIKKSGSWPRSHIKISCMGMGGDPSLQTWPMPAGDGELPGAWMALAICSTVGPLMSHLLFPWESTSWPRDFWWDSFWVLEGHACYVKERTQVHFALGLVPNLFQSGTSV